jgi:hypothetical protein
MPFVWTFEEQIRESYDGRCWHFGLDHPIYTKAAEVEEELEHQ